MIISKLAKYAGNRGKGRIHILLLILSFLLDFMNIDALIKQLPCAQHYIFKNRTNTVKVAS